MVRVSLLVYFNGWVVGARRQRNLLGQVGRVAAVLTVQVVFLAAQIALILHCRNIARREGELCGDEEEEEERE